jgi:hypothetical protein
MPRTVSSNRALAALRFGPALESDHRGLAASLPGPEPRSGCGAALSPLPLGGRPDNLLDSS